MTGNGFAATIREQRGIKVIDLVGEINRDSDAPLRDVYSEAVANGTDSVLLNFTDVSYINSTGIAVIVGILAQARKDGIPITAYGLNSHYREIFDITHLADFMQIYDDESAALAATMQEPETTGGIT